MGFEDWFRLSVHAVITDAADRVLMLKATYGDGFWGLPGGALDPGETIHAALERECMEELGCVIRIAYLSGVYSHPSVRSHAFVFRCEIPSDHTPELSSEHSQFRYFSPAELSPVQRRRVLDCLQYDGNVRSASF